MLRSIPAFATVIALSLAAVPIGVRASHTAHLDLFAATQAGCRAKGVYALPFNIASSTLAPGTYLYTVVALDAGGDLGSGACTPVQVEVIAATHNSTVLQWPAVPGATGYRIHRRQIGVTAALEALIFAAGPVTTIPASSIGCASGGRCTFADRGALTDPTQTTTAVASNTQGGPVDLRVVQRIDYGGADHDTAAAVAGDDPFPAALETDKLQWPRGLVLDATATRDNGNPVRCALTGANSLLGDVATFGGDDPNEDTCPRATLLGNVQAYVRTINGIQLAPGEIYNGQVKGAEAHRLFIVVRPACSAGSVLAPGSTTCSGLLGAPDRQVEKLFLAAVANLVDRGSGVMALDTDLIQAETDSPLPEQLNVLIPDGMGHLARSAQLAMQVRQLTIDLFAFADQGTAATNDDLPFVTLPKSCQRALSTQKTTYDDAAVSSATIALNFSADCLFIDGFEN